MRSIMNKETRIKLRRKARKLRRQGLSYKEIREKIGVTKSTLSLWLKDVPLKPEHRQRLYTRQLLMMARGFHGQKERRAREIDAIIEKAVKDIQLPISDETNRLIGVALYWGEGNKSKGFGITNSDPYLIKFMVNWFQEVFHINPATLKAHLNIYSQQDDLALKHFWSDLTGIPLSNFGKSFVKPANKGYKKNNLYYGTIQIYVPKSIDLMHVVYGWRKAILQRFENEVQFTEKKWIRLKEVSRPANLDSDAKRDKAPIT